MAGRLQPSTAARLYAGITPRMAAISLHTMLLGLLTNWLRDPTLFDVALAGPMLDGLFRGIITDWEPSDDCKDHP